MKQGFPTTLNIQNGDFIDISTVGSCLCAGRTRSGKSYGISCLLIQLLLHGDNYGSEIIIVDPKAATFQGIPRTILPDDDGNMDKEIIMTERRKDNKKRVLKEGEYQRANGTFEYKWRDRRGQRHSIYAKTLDELRDKEIDVLRDTLDGIRSDKKDLTINDLYYLWVKIKRGLKDNTFQNYKYMYMQFVEPDFGHSKKDLKRAELINFEDFFNKQKVVQMGTM